MASGQIGRVTSITLISQLIGQMIVSPLAGYFYDRFGRRIMVAISFALVVTALCWTPYTHDSIFQICCARILLGAGAQI